MTLKLILDDCWRLQLLLLPGPRDHMTLGNSSWLVDAPQNFAKSSAFFLPTFVSDAWNASVGTAQDAGDFTFKPDALDQGCGLGVECSLQNNFCPSGFLPLEIVVFAAILQFYIIDHWPILSLKQYWYWTIFLANINLLPIFANIFGTESDRDVVLGSRSCAKSYWSFVSKKVSLFLEHGPNVQRVIRVKTEKRHCTHLNSFKNSEDTCRDFTC